MSNRYSRYSTRTLVVASHAIAVLTAVCLVVCVATETRSADLPLYPYNYDDPPAEPSPPAPRFHQPDRGKPNAAQPAPEPDRPAVADQSRHERQAEPVTPPPPARPNENQTGWTVFDHIVEPAPRDKPDTPLQWPAFDPRLGVATLPAKPAPELTPVIEAPNPTQSFSITQLLLLALAVLGAAFLVPAALRFIDNSLSVQDPTDPQWGSNQSADRSSPDQSEMSAEEIRGQTEIMRALKEQLDAQVEAARATIREERARAEQQPRKEQAHDEPIT